MNYTLLADLVGLDKIINSDPVAITFFIGYMAMFASAVFFFAERSSVDGKWKLSLLVSGLITGIAAVHYYYMRDFYLQTGASPTAFRYVDWTLTVPLMCVEFYLLTKPFGAKGGTLFKLIVASIVMLVTGYIGETSGLDNNIMWGILSTLGYLYIVYEVFAGDIAKLASSSNSASLGRAMFLLKIFITLGWSIYPIGYMVLPGNLLSGMFEVSSIDLFYNLADAINKIGFGLVVYSVAVAESSFFVPMKKYDYILAGGGCAGLSLVYHLLESSLKDSQILIIDPNQGEIPNKTWCYWSKEALSIHPQAARFSWNSFYLKDSTQQLTQPLSGLSYHHLNSHDFYAHVLEKIRQFPNVHFLKEEVVALTPAGTEMHVSTKDSGTYNSSFVFDSRIASTDLDQSILNQVFIGIRIKVSEPLFDPKKWGLMDFETRNSNGFDFVYTLPFSTQEALVEYTAYTTEERTEEALLKELEAFLHLKYGPIAYDIQFQESGKIPMSTRQLASAVSPRHILIGTAAGWTKPSTGYTFAPIQENCAALIANLEKGIIEGLAFPRKKRFIFYDNILLSIAHHWPKRLPALFINLFSTSSPDLVFRFLAEKTSFWEEIKLLSRLKFGIFLKGLTRYGSY